MGTVCAHCAKKNQEYYTYNKYVCKECERKRARIASRIYTSKNRAKINKKALGKYKKNKKHLLIVQKAYRNKCRKKVFEHYGGSKCFCCGEKEDMFLSIDHIDGGGTKFRRSLKGGGMWTYRWILKKVRLDVRWPLGFQVLCMNCNFGKGQNVRKNGVDLCPHENKT